MDVFNIGDCASSDTWPMLGVYPYQVETDFLVLFSAEGLSSIKISSLDPGSYDMNVYTYYEPHPTWYTNAALFEVGGQSVNVEEHALPVVVEFTGLTPVGGVLQLDVTPIADGGRGSSVGIQLIELIPEPATLSLLVLGGLVAIRRRR